MPSSFSPPRGEKVRGARMRGLCLTRKSPLIRPSGTFSPVRGGEGTISERPMTRLATTFPLALPHRPRGVPAYRWLYDSLRGEILAGRLRPGSRLPGTRDLAEQYGLARGTIVNAFEQLRSEGYVEGSVGSGTYVSAVLPDELLHAPRAISSTEARPRRRLSTYAKRLPAASQFDGGRARAFRTDLPALDLFPAELWARVAAKRMRKLSTKLLHGTDSIGYPPLRAAISDYLGVSRGVRCSAEQIVIVSGVQDALDLVARLTLNQGDRVCIENPGYQGAAEIFEAAGARISPIALDEQGMRVPRERDARLAYITPAHQFPLGMTMSIARRLELLQWALANDALLFEDDYDSEYRYAGRPVPALQGLDASGHVLFFGSFSKVLFPSLRIGYLVVPEDLVPRFASAISLTRRRAPLLDQAVLCDFIVEGHFGRHLRRMRQIYAERLGVLIESAREQLAGMLDIVHVEAGLQTAGWLAKGLDATRVAERAAQRGVEVAPLSRHSRRALRREGLQFGFAAIDAAEIRRGMRELAAAMRDR